MHRLMTALAAVLLLSTPAVAQRDWGGRGDQGGGRWSNDGGNRTARSDHRGNRDANRGVRVQDRGTWNDRSVQRAAPRRDGIANRSDRMGSREQLDRRGDRDWSNDRRWSGNDRRWSNDDRRWAGNDPRRRYDRDRTRYDRERYRYDHERYRYDRDRYRYDRNRYADRGRYGYGRPAWYSWPYRSWGRGQHIPRSWWGGGGWNPYMIGNYGRYGLYHPPRGFAWIRYHDDLLLVALTSGLVREVMRGYWRDRDDDYYYYD